MGGPGNGEAGGPAETGSHRLHIHIPPASTALHSARRLFRRVSIGAKIGRRDSRRGVTSPGYSPAVPPPQPPLDTELSAASRSAPQNT